MECVVIAKPFFQEWNEPRNLLKLQEAYDMGYTHGREMAAFHFGFPGEILVLTKVHIHEHIASCIMHETINMIFEQ